MDPKKGFCNVEWILSQADEDEDSLHITPTDAVHDLSSSCWCEPECSEKDSETGKEVWVHKQFH